MENLNVINTFIGATIPLVILYLGIRLERQRNETERKYKIRMQFDLEGKVLGPQAGYYILDISAILENRGLVRLVIGELELKIRGIEQDAQIELFENHSKDKTRNLIAGFPKKLVNTNMLQPLDAKQEKEEKREKEGNKRYFVEPGVEQRISYVARIPENVGFILVRAQFEYSKEKELDLPNGNDQKSQKKSTHSAQVIMEINPSISRK